MGLLPFWPSDFIPARKIGSVFASIIASNCSLAYPYIFLFLWIYLYMNQKKDNLTWFILTRCLHTRQNICSGLGTERHLKRGTREFISHIEVTDNIFINENFSIYSVPTLPYSLWTCALGPASHAPWMCMVGHVSHTLWTCALGLTMQLNNPFTCLILCREDVIMRMQYIVFHRSLFWEKRQKMTKSHTSATAVYIFPMHDGLHIVTGFFIPQRCFVFF